MRIDRSVFIVAGGSSGLGAAVGIAPFAYAALTGYLWLLFCWDYLSGWLEANG